MEKVGELMHTMDIEGFYNGKRVLVTGHTGFKGTWLCKVLSMMGAKVYGYALEADTDPSIFKILGGQRWVDSTIGDVRDFERMKRCIDNAAPEYIFHLAAQPIVRESYRIPRETYETNVMGTVNILECIRHTRGVRGFLNITTDKVYENDDTNDHPFTEAEKLDGYDPYSNSKSCSELVTHSYKRSFFSGEGSVAISTARAGNVIGGGDFSADRIIPDCVRDTIKGSCIRIRNVSSIRPYQHVLEPISVYLLIMMMQDKDKRFAGYYNVGPDEGDCITTGNLASMFVDRWGKDARWEKIEEIGASHEASFLKLDCTKLKKTFGWRPVWDINDAVKETVEWYKVWQRGDECNTVTERQICDFFKKSGHWD